MQLAYGLTLLVALCSSLALASRSQIGNTIKSAMAWVAIGLALVTLYTYQDGFHTLSTRVLAALDPAQPQVEDGRVTLRANSDGHFMATAEVENVRVRFLVDTGASSVVLTKRDAERIGIDVDDLNYSLQVSTANGVAMAAPIRLRTITIGSIELKGVNAIVAGDGLDVSLLGMTALRRLKAEFTRRELILSQ